MTNPIDMGERRRQRVAANSTWKTLRPLINCNALGERIGKSGATIRKWDRVPAENVRAVSRVLMVRAEVLRPDIFEENEPID